MVAERFQSVARMERSMAAIAVGRLTDSAVVIAETEELNAVRDTWSG